MEVAAAATRGVSFRLKGPQIMSDPLRWGILGTGNIARQFAAGVAASERGTLAAVGSRTIEAANVFERAQGTERSHGSYEALLDDSAVDAIYVSLPNQLHHEWTIRALKAGKHVLCEKPFAVTSAEAAEMFQAAEKVNRRVMEAFMYRTHPLTHAVLDAVRGRAIGELRLIRTSFCYRSSKIEGNIRFNKALAGGGLMDVGCYCVDFSRLVAGCEPSHVHAVGRLHESGVDDAVAGTLRFPNGVMASFTCGMTVQADNSADICGTEGYIEIPVPWKPLPPEATFVVAHSTPPKMDGGPKAGVPIPRDVRRVPVTRNVYAYEADAFAAAVQDGAPLPITPADTLGNMKVLEELRRQVEASAAPAT